MKRLVAIVLGAAALGAALVAGMSWAQGPAPIPPGGPMQHGPLPPGGQTPHGQSQPGVMHHMHHPAGGEQRLAGQGAFVAMAEVVRLLDADPATDWSRVDMERLRQHLIDMSEVVLRATVRATPVPGGLAMDVTGTGRTTTAIRDMVIPHAAELDRMPAWSAKAEPIADGVRLTVVAQAPADAREVARIRGLGFAGLLVQGEHHVPHHLAMARGELPGAHKH